MVATSAIQLKPEICAEKKRLARQYIEALHQVMELQDQQLAALTRGGQGLQRFELALGLARQRRDRAKRLYVVHLTAHGC